MPGGACAQSPMVLGAGMPRTHDATSDNERLRPSGAVSKVLRAWFCVFWIFLWQLLGAPSAGGRVLPGRCAGRRCGRLGVVCAGHVAWRASVALAAPGGCAARSRALRVGARPWNVCAAWCASSEIWCGRATSACRDTGRLAGFTHGVVLLDEEGRIEWCNDTAAEHFVLIRSAMPSTHP